MGMGLPLIGLGIFAGTLTTVAGLGGGQLLVLALAALVGPREALAISAPALLLGNLHRVLMYRRDVDWRVGRLYAAGALPAAAAGGLAAVALPLWVLEVLLCGSTVFAVARAAGWIEIRPPARALPLAGAGIGVLCATSTGAGLLLAPLLLSTGLTGARYIGTGALCAAAMHVGRIGGYAAGGSFGGELLGSSALVAAAILLGNVAGDRLRGRLPGAAAPWIEHGTLAACVLLAVLQLR
jgi:uncharacterized membrane protein YfcA